MKTGRHSHLRRILSVTAVAVLASTVTACTGRGGGQLPPDGVVFSGPASFGFTFSCERSSRSTRTNPKPGRLRIELAYVDHGSNPIGSAFGIHGIVDKVDPMLESMICIGQDPPPEPDPNMLIFLGRYRLVSSAPGGFPSTCPARETRTTPLCRFEVVVRDNDVDRAPSPGDYFQIRLSSGTELDDELDPEAVFYTRPGLLSGGNITVD